MMASHRPLAAMRLIAVAGGACALAAWSATCTEYDSSLLTYSHFSDASPKDGSSPDAPTGDTALPDVQPDAPPEADAGQDADTGTSTPCDPTCNDPSLARAPCPPAISDPPDQAQPLIFAMHSIRAGMSASAPNDWKTIGLDLDCLFTQSNGSPMQCKPLTSTTSVVADGDQGRDNSFGNNLGGLIRLMEQFNLITVDVEQQWNDSLAKGGTGLLFEIDKFGGGTDDPQVLVSVFLSRGVYDPTGTTQLTANWDGNDYWAIDRDSVTPPQNQPKYVDDAAYVTANRVVGHLPDGLPLKFVAGSGLLQVSLTNSVFILDLSQDHQHIVSGVLSGVWYTSEAVSALDAYAAQSGICPDTPQYAAARGALSKASDIRVDLKPAPDLDCNGMSIGMAFTADPARLGAVVDPPTPNPSQCGDAGADAN